MTEIVTATQTEAQVGPLTRLVYEFTKTQGQVLAAGVKSPDDYEPVAAFIDRDAFKRIGAYLEELNWEEYKRFLSGWAAGGTQFEYTDFHISEIGNTVFQEIEERHTRGDQFIRKNVIAVYRFNEARKIVHLDIYEQAKDSGRWIQESADAAMAAA
jgi:hypothetical protein